MPTMMCGHCDHSFTWPTTAHAPSCPNCGALRCSCGVWESEGDRGYYCESPGCNHTSHCYDVCPDCLRCSSCGCECGSDDGEDSTLREIHSSPAFHGEPTARFPRYLGVEIECGVTRDGYRLVEQAIRAWRGASIHDDGSVNVRTDDGHNSSAEYVTAPARGDAFVRQVEEITGAIARAGGKVNRSCGLHCHVDARDLTPGEVIKVVRTYARIERTLYTIVARSRRENTFCGPWGDVLIAGDVGDDSAPVAKRIEQLGANTYGSKEEAEGCRRSRYKHGSRYHGLNLNALDIHGTLEFRLHHGTIDPRKIVMWAALCTAIVEYARTHTEDEILSLRGTPAEILDSILTDREIARWVKARRRFFEDQDRARRGLPPRRAARAPAPPPPEPIDPGPVEGGEIGNDGARIGRRMSYGR